MRPKPPTSQGALAVGVVAGAFVLGACGEDEADTTTTGPGAAAAEACEEVPAAEPKRVKLKPPRRQVGPADEITATVETNCGDFEIALDRKVSPKTVSSFVQLVEERVYDGTPFHRVVDGFVIQGGDPAADGTGGPGYTITEEPPPDTSYTEGMVAMAKTGLEPAGASGSQFFVVVTADAALPPEYAVLGELSGGEETVERIESLADPALGPEGGEPAVPVVIERITLDR